VGRAKKRQHDSRKMLKSEPPTSQRYLSIGTVSAVLRMALSAGLSTQLVRAACRCAVGAAPRSYPFHVVRLATQRSTSAGNGCRMGPAATGAARTIRCGGSGCAAQHRS
jgi:hypothetical protein